MSRRNTYYGSKSNVIDLLLNTYPTLGDGFSCARKLDKNYAGGSLRVRRSSDSTELDIGFINNDLDIADLLAFTGGGDGFIRTLYGQQNSINLNQTNTSFQPKIVSSGSLITEHGKPAMLFDGAGDYLTAGNMLNSIDGTILGFSVGDLTSTGGFLFGKSIAANEGNRYGVFTTAGSTRAQLRTNTNANADTTSASLYGKKLFTINYDKLKTDLSVNNAIVSTTNLSGSLSTSTRDFEVGRFSGSSSFNLNGTCQEIVMYLTDNSSNITGIQNNIIGYYGL